MLRVTENLLEILVAGGIGPQDAVWACDILVSLVIAVASEEDVRRARGRTEEDRRALVDEFYETFTRLPPDRFPFLAAHATEMVAGDPDERFRFGIDVIIDGLVARVAKA